jgi:hypothetical protein
MGIFGDMIKFSLNLIEERAQLNVTINKYTRNGCSLKVGIYEVSVCQRIRVLIRYSTDGVTE